ncbi:MAG: DUF4097 domain-containing protein [Bacteroidetes bacterium]|nr:DUF4097 domain-containing protein [Bacteroidota bacterium]
MKTYMIKTAILLFVSLFMLPAFSKADFLRTIKKDFSVNPDAQLVIDNKYGKVQCISWDKLQVTIEVTITVSSPSEKAAKDILEDVQIDISGSPSQVKAITNLEQVKLPRNGKLTIDYQVNMPAGVSLDVRNKFGDTFIGEVKGKSLLDISYGKLIAEKLLHPDNEVTVKFGSGRITQMQGKDLEVKYSTFEVVNAGTLAINAKYSDIVAMEIQSANIDSEGGSMKITKSGQLNITSKFSDFKIGTISKGVILKNQYGTFDVGKFASGFESINIDNKFGSINLILNPEASYRLDATMKFCDLDYPSDGASVNVSNVSHTEKQFKGRIGKNRDSASKVTIMSEFGNVNLKH